jgi:hypothetical protein
MNTPLCPLMMQARATAPKLIVGWEDFRDGEKPASVTDGPLYPNPSDAPGVACIGSRCAAWVNRYPEQGSGRCGMTPGDSQYFTDPAFGG